MADHMTQKTKQTGLLLLLGALISLFLLASSLSNLQLSPGSPFPGGGNSQAVIPSDTGISPVQTYSSPILRGLFALTFIILLFYLPARLIALANIKSILQLLFAIVLLIIIGYMLPRISPGQPEYYPKETSELTTLPSFDYPVTPLGQPPQILVWIVIMGVALGMGLLFIKLVKRWQVSSQLETELLEEAEQAVNDIQAGLNLRNVIFRCYVSMTRTLQEEQGIERKHSMTVREFEHLLTKKGFPTAPVHQLTQLFEKFRYSKGSLGNNDEKVAIESLNEIIQFCRAEKDWTQ
jgi:hypothetical protein